MVELLNAAHLRWALGRFELVPDGRIRWRHRVDFEGTSPTGVSLLRIIQAGWDCAASFVDAISAVAMTNQNAAQAIEEYDEAEAAARAEANDGAPTEL